MSWQDWVLILIAILAAANLYKSIDLRATFGKMQHLFAVKILGGGSVEQFTERDVFLHTRQAGREAEDLLESVLKDMRSRRIAPTDRIYDLAIDLSVATDEAQKAQERDIKILEKLDFKYRGKKDV